MKKKTKKKLSTYQKSLIIFTLVLLILCEAFLIYVNVSLKAYEKGDINNYMNYLVNDIKDQGSKGNIKKYLSLSDVSSDYEKKSSLKDGYKDLLKNANMRYEKTDTKNVYNIFADDLLIATVSLDDSKTEHRLGLLTYTNYEIKDMKSYNEDGLYNIDFYLKNDYDLYINDVKVKDNDLKDAAKINELSEAYDLVTLPTSNHYHIVNLTKKPDIKVKDKDGNDVKYDIDGNNYYATDYFKTNDIKEAMGKLSHEFDPIVFAKNWSLFLTNDLSGALHGFYTLSGNLINDTAMYKKAYAWATGVDVTFTSLHNTPTFTGEKVSNITVYNENAFSAEVYLEKNMTLIDNQKKTDVLHEMLYFVYYDGAYRLLSMKTVA